LISVEASLPEMGAMRASTMGLKAGSTASAEAVAVGSVAGAGEESCASSGDRPTKRRTAIDRALPMLLIAFSLICSALWIGPWRA
jgi:hypothetical protein